MANVKISELNELTQVDNDDLLVIVDTSTNETKKVKAENVGTGGGNATPIGTVEAYSGSNAPEGYLMCDGSAISRTTYKDLFDIIGTTYGTGDGSTTFNLPNLKGRVVVMLDSTQTEFDTLGETGGEKTHTLTVNEMPSHNHSINGLKSQTGLAAGNEWNIANPVTTGNTGGGQAHNNLQPYIVLNYIIKAYKTSSTPVESQVLNSYSSSTNNVYSCDYINNNDSYSTTETKTNKRWTDNKPIYRKVVSISYPANTTTGSYDLALTNVNEIVSLQTLVYRNGDYEGSYYNNSSDYFRMWYRSSAGTKLEVRSAGNSVDETIKVIVEYTKTTD